MTVAILGTGLMGTSIGLAAGHGSEEVVGWDPDPGSLQGAVDRGAVAAAVSLEEAVGLVRVAFVCTPVSAIPQVAAAALRAGEAVVTDVGSAKVEVMAGLRREVKGDVGLLRRFVGGHPMTGSERSGPGAGSASLLDGAVWALTPGEETDEGAVARVEELVRALGATPVRLPAERHDRMVALVSHLPQVVSTALMRTASHHAVGEPELLMLAAGGFRDLTRLASSNPELWADILLANRDPVLRAIEAYARGLRELAELMLAGDAVGLAKAFSEAKRARLAVSAKPQARLGVAVLSMPVPDRPGVLAEITSVLGERSLNIEDLEIVHSAEGGRGTVHLTVEEGKAEDAARVLKARGYEVARLA